MEQRPERNGKRPFHAQPAHVRLVDCGERAVAVSAHVSVERRPLASLRIENPAEINSRVGNAGGDATAPGLYAGQPAQIRDHVAQLVGARLHGGHVRRFLFGDGRDVIERQRVKRACQILDGQVETAAASREAAQHSTVALANRNHAITGSDPRVGIQQRVSNFVHGQRQRDIREIGSDRRALTLREMARHALPLPDKKLAASGGITGNAGFCRHRVPRRDHRRERIDRVGRKIECGHPGGGDPISNDIEKALSGSRANRQTSSKCRPLLRAPAIVSMASAATLRVRLLDIRRILLRP